MISEKVRQSRRFLETEGRGQLGQEYLYDFLSESLEGTGLVVKQMSEESHCAPFDLLILKGKRVLVGIENKDLSVTTLGTWIKGRAKERKLAYAQEQGIEHTLTTVTIRDAGRIGFCRGLANSHVMRYDFDRDHLLQEIREASA